MHFEFAENAGRAMDVRPITARTTR